MKLATLVNSKEALTTLMKQNLPIAMAWELKIFMSAINSELTSFEEIKTNKVINYGEPQEGSRNSYKVKPENLEIYFKELSEILEKEVEVKVPVIKMSEILEYNKGLDKKINLTTEDMMILSWLLV